MDAEQDLKANDIEALCQLVEGTTYAQHVSSLGLSVEALDLPEPSPQVTPPWTADRLSAHAPRLRLIKGGKAYARLVFASSKRLALAADARAATLPAQQAWVQVIRNERLRVRLTELVADGVSRAVLEVVRRGHRGGQLLDTCSLRTPAGDDCVHRVLHNQPTRLVVALIETDQILLTVADELVLDLRIHRV